MPYKDLVKKKEYDIKYNEEQRQHAYNSIKSGKILYKNKWDSWCNTIKNNAMRNNYPYSDDFTNDFMFEMMVRGCFYCGELATTIDRIDSKLYHIPGNCIGCCKGCNNSKGATDSATFIRKAYYRARGKYFDDMTNIWFVHTNRPSMYIYKQRANKKGVPFGLSKEDFNDLISGDCEYCKRIPTTWFGIDRVTPSLGYVLSNAVSCCFDCNLDKLDNDAKTMMKRNERIADRVDAGELIITECDKVILHNGANKISYKVCVYGNVYESQRKASFALEKYGNYIFLCIQSGRYSNDIFEITDEFYNFAITNKLENITKKMYLLFNRM